VGTWLLAAILALGLLVRLLHFWAITGTAFPKIGFVFTQSDMYANWHWAQTILAGDWLGRETYHPYFEWMKRIAPLETWYRWWGGKAIFQQAPLYPYLLAGLWALCRGSVTGVLLVQLLIGAVQPLVMYRLASRLFDPRVGLVAAGLTALYGPFIFHQGVLLRDWLPPLLEPLALLALLRAKETGRGTAWLWAGAALGLALLAKETIFLFLPLVLLWIGLEHGCARRRMAVACAFLGVGFLLAFSPVLARNVLVGARPLPVSNRMAEGLIIGNAADGDPVGLFHAPASMKGILERSEGRLGAVIVETLKTYHGDYGRFLRTQFLKLRGVVNPYEVPNNVSFYYGLEISPVLRFLLRYWAIFPVGVAGLLLSLPGESKVRLLHFYLGTAMLGLWLQPIRARYRLVAVSALLLFGAAFLVWLWRAVRQRQTARLIGATTLCLAVGLIQIRLLALAAPRYYVHGTEYIYTAESYAREGRFDRAVAAMARLRENEQQTPGLRWWSVPASLPEGDYRVLWARQLLKEGRREAARQQVEGAESAYAAHSDLSYPAYNLGELYLALDEPGKAKAFFQRFLALEPEGPRADRVRIFLGGRQGSGR
jgi:hypothetical protein